MTFSHETNTFNPQMRSLRNPFILGWIFHSNPPLTLLIHKQSVYCGVPQTILIAYTVSPNSAHVLGV